MLIILHTGILNSRDVCPELNSTNTADVDVDGVGDECDNCPKISNSNQVLSNENFKKYG